MLNELSAKELGAKLKELREYHGYTQQEIVKLLGVGRAVYGMYESGERTININNLAKLSQFYNISLDWFFDKAYKTITPFVISHINDKLQRLGHSITLVLKAPYEPNLSETVKIIINDSWVDSHSSLNLTKAFYEFLEMQLEHFGIKNIMYNNDKTIFWTKESN